MPDRHTPPSKTVSHGSHDERQRLASPPCRLRGARGKCAMGLVVLVVLAGPIVNAARAEVPKADIEKMTAAAPDKPTVKPTGPRKLLVFTLCKGFKHSSIPHGAAALTIMGKKTGAFETVISDDPSMFEPSKLGRFDAVCFMKLSVP